MVATTVFVSLKREFGNESNGRPDPSEVQAIYAAPAVNRFVSLDYIRADFPAAGRNRSRVATFTNHSFRNTRRSLLRPVISAPAWLASGQRIIWSDVAGLGKKQVYFTKSEIAGAINDDRGRWHLDPGLRFPGMAQIGWFSAGDPRLPDRAVTKNLPGFAVVR